MKHTGTIEIETERLILRKFKLIDAEQMFKNYTSKEKVTEYLTWWPHKTVNDTKNYLQNIVLPEYNNKNTYRWAIVWKENNEVIGCIDVVKNSEEKSRAELGWVISDDYWGRGIMPEAAKVVIELLFKVGYIRIEAIHDVKNPKSGRVMEKVGMKHEGLLRKYNPDKTGELKDCDMWSIIKDEYEKNK